MDGFKKCTSRSAPSVCRFLQQNPPKPEVTGLVTSSARARRFGLAGAASIPFGQSPTCSHGGKGLRKNSSASFIRVSRQTAKEVRFKRPANQEAKPVPPP